MSLPDTLDTQLVIIVFFALSGLALLLGLLLTNRHNRKMQRLDTDLSSAQHQFDLQSQRLEQQQVMHEELQASADNLDAQLLQARSELGELRTKLAVDDALNQQLTQAKQQLSQKEAELSTLQANTSAELATHKAEKVALEDKLVLLKEAREQLNGEFKVLANKIFDEKQRQFTEQSQTALQASVDPLKAQIESFRKKVEDAYDKENAERNKLVGSIAELQKQTLQIGQDAINLTQALKGDNKAQGNWGEVILERLLEESGLQKGREYEVQVALKDEEGHRRNPDVILRLPEGKDIVIDSKVSLIHYERSVSAVDDSECDSAIKQHVASVRTHIQQLSSKSYEKLEGIRSLDFVFLFVPVEAAFMAALQKDPALFQEAYSKHIVLVSPTTLLASLRTVENIWRYEKQNRNAEEIAKQAGGLHDQFVLLFESFEDIGKQLDKANTAYETTRKRWVSGRGNLMRRVDGLRELGAKTKKRIELSAVEDGASVGAADESASQKVID
ncbi:MAG: DNA recombination protein RmuC [Cellvibrionaceae bacterium]